MLFLLCGRGMEYVELCDYVVGDDVCYIDWCVIVCIGCVYIKLF